MQKLNGTAEDYAKAALSKLENVIAAMPANVYWIDTNFVCLGCNDNFVKLLGLGSQQEVVGRSYEELAKLSHWPEDVWQSFKKQDLQAINTAMGKESIEESVVYDRDGNEQYFLSSRKPLIDKEGKIEGLVVISIDISSRKQMEKASFVAKERAEAENKVKAEYITSMTHDLRAPLTDVIGLASILEQEGGTQNSREFAHTIQVSAEQLLQSLDDVLEIVSTDKTPIKPQTALPTINQPITTGKQAFKVLVIEDDAIARRVAKSLLTRAGFEVADVEDAEQGFWHVMKGSYDLILADIGLPLMDGIEFTNTVRAWEKATRHALTPIVGLTAHGKSQQAAAEAAGMNMLFSKPFDEQKLQKINESFFIEKPELAKRTTSTEKKTTGLGYDLPETEEELFKLDIYPILDEKWGEEGLGGDMNFFREILCMLLDQTIPEELPLLVAAHNEGNWAQVQLVAHKLKSAALHCGTIRLRYACQYTERYRLAGHSKLLEYLYQQTLVVVEETINYLNKWLMRKNID